MNALLNFQYLAKTNSDYYLLLLVAEPQNSILKKSNFRSGETGSEINPQFHPRKVLDLVSSPFGVKLIRY